MRKVNFIAVLLVAAGTVAAEVEVSPAGNVTITASDLAQLLKTAKTCGVIDGAERILRNIGADSAKLKKIDDLRKESGCYDADALVDSLVAAGEAAKPDKEAK